MTVALWNGSLLIADTAVSETQSSCVMCVCWKVRDEGKREGREREVWSDLKVSVSEGREERERETETKAKERRRKRVRAHTHLNEVGREREARQLRWQT